LKGGREIISPNLVMSQNESLRYLLKYHQYFINLPLERAKVKTLPLSEVNFTVGVKQALRGEKKEELDIILQCLKSYKKYADPVSAAQLLNIEKGRCTILDREPMWLVYYPWEHQSVSEKKASTHRWYIEKELGLKQGCTLSDEEEVLFEAKRTHDLMKSIQKRGYIPNYRGALDITVQLLIREDGDYRGLIRGGIHRASVCQALCYHQLEVNVQNLIFRKDVDVWPAVKTGIFDRDVALTVFDNLFFSDYHQNHKTWIYDYT